MKIISLHLENFRNYSRRELKVTGGVNVIVGENGSGKTNILEAVFFLSTTRSHRSAAVREMINWQEKGFYLKAVAEKDDVPVTLEMGFARDGSRAIKVNNQPVRSRKDVVGILPVVMFSPEDLLLIKEDPSLRRRFIDIFISQVDQVYLADLQKYNRIILDRNSALALARQGKTGPEELDVWDENAVKTGLALVRKRQEMIKRLEGSSTGVFKRISGKDGLKLEYITNAPDAGTFLKRLRDKRKLEMELGITTTGPHRDDIKITSEGKDLRDYGSQGQQRVAAIAMKIGQLKVMREELDGDPVILFDDVTSELDRERRKYFFKSVGETDGKSKPQVFITATSVDEIDPEVGEMNVIRL